MKSALVLAVILSMPVLGQAKETCTYEMDPHSLEVSWTAFKTTQKVAVPGTFTGHELKGATKARTLRKLLEGLRADVSLKTVDSKNPGRDKTLREKFFDLIKPASADGQLMKVSEKDHKAELKLLFNGKRHVVPMTFTLDEGSGLFVATGSMDLTTFAAEPALESLNKACEKLHAGADGVSKTWPDVTITLKAKIAHRCR